MTVADVPEVDIDELEQLMADGAAVFDVRELHEFCEARIPGAVSVPLVGVPESLERFRRAAQDAPVLVVCAKGGRSAQAVGFLRSHGVDALNVAGGTDAWLLSGRPAET